MHWSPYAAFSLIYIYIYICIYIYIYIYIYKLMFTYEYCQLHIFIMNSLFTIWAFCDGNIPNLIVNNVLELFFKHNLALNIIYSWKRILYFFMKQQNCNSYPHRVQFWALDEPNEIICTSTPTWWKWKIHVCHPTSLSAKCTSSVICQTLKRHYFHQLHVFISALF